nr:hypothetical protein [Tanacetum cinerariifolium]
MKTQKPLLKEEDGEEEDVHKYSIPGNLKTLAKGFYPPSLNFLSFNWESFADEAVYKELGDRLTKTTQKKEIASQQDEIASLKKRVKKLEKRNRSRTHGLKILYKVGLSTRVESSGNEESLGQDASKQGRRINAIDV